MAYNLTEKEIQTLWLIAMFPIAFVEGPTVDRLIQLRLVDRPEDETLNVTDEGRRLLKIPRSQLD